MHDGFFKFFCKEVESLIFIKYFTSLPVMILLPSIHFLLEVSGYHKSYISLTFLFLAIGSISTRAYLYLFFKSSKGIKLIIFLTSIVAIFVFIYSLSLINYTDNIITNISFILAITITNEMFYTLPFMSILVFIHKSYIYAKNNLL